MAARPTYTGGRTTYDGRHAVTGERQTFTGQQTPGRGGPVSKAAPAGKERGVLGRVGHYVGGQLDLAGRDIKGMGGGVIHQANVGVFQPWKNLVTIGHPYSHGAGQKIDAEIAKTVNSINETANHPGRDLFATFTLVAPALHGVGRAGVGAVEATRAAKAGEGVKGVLQASTRRPEDIPRALKQGGKETPLIPSRGGFGRIAQMGYDKVVQNALNKNEKGQATGPLSKRVAAHGAKRIGGALKEEGRISQRSKAVPAVLLDKAAGKLSKIPARRREEQAALELTSVQTTAEEAAAYHRGQAEKGVNPDRNLGVAKLYDRVAKRGLVTEQGGKVVVDAAKFPKLAKADTALSRVQGEGDAILEEKNVRSKEALQSRNDAPGRVREGATYEKPTPAKAGVESPGLKRERARLTSLQSRYEDALNKDAAALAKQRNRDLGSLSEADAKARLAELDKTYEAQVRTLIPESSPYSRSAQQRETAYRNAASAKPRARKQPTVKDEEFQIAESKLLDTVAKNPKHPVAARMASVIAERDKLRGALNARAESGFAGEEPKALPSAPARLHASVPRASRPQLDRIVQLGHALEGQKARVAQAEKAAVSRVKATGIVGGEQARPGRGFVSYRASEKKVGQAEASASRGPVIGAARSPIDSKSFTGRSIEQGFVPKHVTASASRHFRQILKFVNTDAQRRKSLETGSDLKRSVRDVLVREPNEKAKPLTAEALQSVGKATSNVDTAEELATEEGLRAAHEMLLDHILPGRSERFSSDKSQQIGVKAPEGYKWVDRNTLGDLASSPRGPRGKIAKSVDNVNSAITAATVYFKIGHVGTRVLTNAATNIMQGSANPKQIGYAYKLWDKMDEEQRARSLAASGQHGFSSLPHEGTNLVSLVAGKGAQWWAQHADSMFRFNSLSFELRKAGYDTPEKFTQALDHLESGGQGLPAHEWSRLSAAARRADREAISYDRLNDFEKRFITRAVWFYPWIKGSTLFTVRSYIEHPFKSAYLGNAGQQGREQQLQSLGQTPSYEAGLISLGGGQAPLTTDLSTFSPFATAADVLEAPAQPGALSGFLNPAAGTGGQFLYGLNRYNGASTTPYRDALLSLAAATPEQQFAEAVAARNADQSGKMFPKSPGGIGLRFLVGPALPRRVNRSALAQAAAREKSGRR